MMNFSDTESRNLGNLGITYMVYSMESGAFPTAGGSFQDKRPTWFEKGLCHPLLVVLLFWRFTFSIYWHYLLSYGFSNLVQRLHTRMNRVLPLESSRYWFLRQCGWNSNLTNDNESYFSHVRWSSTSNTWNLIWTSGAASYFFINPAVNRFWNSGTRLSWHLIDI